LLSLPRGTEMFQFPRFPLPAVCVRAGVTPHDGCRVSPFGYPRIKAWSAAPRGFSQPPTSFIGVRRQGIHRWLFVAWKNKDARARYVVLKEPRRGQHDAESGDEDAGVPTGPRRRSLEVKEGRSLKTEERNGRRARALPSGGKHLQPTTLPWTGPSEAPTGSRPCVRRNLDSLERR
jgi:hypothetical protein